jgi:PAS domain S-box-containing protein
MMKAQGSSEERFRLIVEAAPNAIVMVDGRGKIVLVNSQTEKLFGYRRAELIGQPVEILVPERFRPNHPGYRADFLSHPQARPMGAGRDLYGLHKNGSEFPVEIGLNPVETEEETLVLSAVVDITERKRAEDRFRLAIESAPNAMVMVNGEGKIVLVNAQTEKLFGYGREELVGQVVEILVPPRFRDGHPEFRKLFFSRPQVRPMGAGRDLFGMRKDGQEFPVEIGLNPIETEEGTLVLSAIVDITARKKAEERFRLVVESTPNAIVVVDREGRMVLVNSQTERLFGYNRSELVGQSVEMLVPHRFRENHADYRGAFFADPQARPMGAGRDLFGLRKDGSEFPVEIGLNPMETEEGTLVLSAVVDITERKRAQDALAKQAHELARVNAELQEFAYVASHDLQEPLRAVAGCVQLLKERYYRQLDSRADEFVQHAVEGASRMKTLISDLLTYSRLGSRPEAFKAADCSRILKGALANLGVAIEESGAVIQFEDLPVVLGDPTQLTQLFQNLLANAIKFRKASPPSIQVSAMRRGGEWLFAVRDDGIGIEPEYFDRIFRVFQRLHGRSEYPGTGIGLAICKKVVERHGGRIWVESKANQGSTFYFTIPAASSEGLSA